MIYNKFHLLHLANCPPGTSYDAVGKNCSQCNIGFYQDEQGHLSCERCPIGASTEVIGAKHASDCKG